MHSSKSEEHGRKPTDEEDEDFDESICEDCGEPEDECDCQLDFDIVWGNKLKEKYGISKPFQ